MFPKTILILGLVLGSLITTSALACTMETIEKITNEVDPYYGNKVAGSLDNAIRVLGLCDENLGQAGILLGRTFDPYYRNSTQEMSQTVTALATQLHPELRRGLSEGMIEKVDLYYQTSKWIMRSVYDLAKADSSLAKPSALALMKKSDSYYRDTDSYLKSTVDNLIRLAQTHVVDPIPSGSIWSFRSENKVCKSYPGPWGKYYVCPQYSASVADMKGNRILLTCSSMQDGIEMQLRLASESWMQIEPSTVSGVAFGTNSIRQSMGIPFVLPEHRVLILEEVLSEEVLTALQRDKTLSLKVRSRSGEKELQLNVPLSGSNAAISKLRSVCQ